jgi:integrase
MKERKPHPDKALTAVQVRNIKKSGRHADGNGLYLVVDPSGAKRWILRTVVRGKRKDMGLGSVRLIPLADARDRATHYRRIARDGGDPLAERQAEKAKPTFREAAEKVHAENRKGWRNAKHASQWINSLRDYAFPLIGARRVDHIDTADVQNILLPIWLDKPETGRRVKQRIKTVLDWATTAGHRTGENPAYLVDKGLPRQTDKQKHHKAMPYDDVPAFVQGLNDDTFNDVKAALEFTILTAARTGEVIHATFEEFDLDEKVWTVPADRMKANVEHRVPLVDRCVAIIEQAKAQNQTGFVFRGKRIGKPLGNVSMLNHLQRAELPLTVHGFRSSFRDWAADFTSFSREVCEAALAHTLQDKTEAAYRRTDLFDRRRKLMEAWASFLSAEVGEVVQLRRKT